MNKVDFFKIAASSLVLGASFAATDFGVQARVSSVSSATPSAKQAAIAAQKARKFLAKQNYAKAIVQAEMAVAGSPGISEFRALLGQAYLGAGRFQSAETALSDAFSLDPSNGRAGLSLALAQIALAKNSAALETLEKARGQIGAADFGLAQALAGDTDAAVKMLERAVRGLEADVKARQNLALAYALAGRWGNARVMAAQDLAPDMVDARLTEWAAFARPQASWDQVASLLGVKPAWDPGQPTRLALNASDTQVAAAREPVAEPVTVAMAEPEMPQMGADSPSESVPAYETAEVEAPKPAFQQVVMAEPVAESAPEPELIRSEPMPVKQAVVPAARPVARVETASAPRPKGVESGNFVVQLGAYTSEARAQVAWKNAYGKTRELGNFNMHTPKVQVKSASLYRLSVSGFTTVEAANQVCRKVRATGGDCFVRSIAGGAPLQWASRKAPASPAKAMATKPKLPAGGTKLAARK